MRTLLIGLLTALSLSAHAKYDQEYKGLYYFGTESETFRACNSKEVHGVGYGFGAIHSDLKSFQKNAATEPGQPVYIEFIGHSHLDDAGGLIGDRPDGAIYINKIINLRVNPPADCK